MSTDIGFRTWLRGEAFVESILSNFPVKSVRYIATIVVTSRAQNSRQDQRPPAAWPLFGTIFRKGNRCHDRRSTLSWQEPGEQRRWARCGNPRHQQGSSGALLGGTCHRNRTCTISNDIEHAGHILVDRKLLSRTCSFRDTRGNAVSSTFENKPRVFSLRR